MLHIPRYVMYLLSKGWSFRSSEFIVNHEGKGGGLNHILKLRQARCFVINHIRFSFDKHFLASRSEINDPIEVFNAVHYWYGTLLL